MCKVTKTIALVLLIVGGLNWGLVGAFDFDLVATIFGAKSLLANIVYCLVGISAIFIAIAHFTCCKKSACCGTETCETETKK